MGISELYWKNQTQGLIKHTRQRKGAISVPHKEGNISYCNGNNPHWHVVSWLSVCVEGPADRELLTVPWCQLYLVPTAKPVCSNILIPFTQSPACTQSCFSPPVSLGFRLVSAAQLEPEFNPVAPAAWLSIAIGSLTVLISNFIYTRQWLFAFLPLPPARLLWTPRILNSVTYIFAYL